MANPRLYNNNYTKIELREPHVEENLMSDLYISALQLVNSKETAQGNTLTLSKGETRQYAGYDIQFSTFDMDSHQEKNGEFKVAAVLNLTKDNKSFEIKPAVIIRGQERVSEPARFAINGRQDTKAEITLSERYKSGRQKNTNFIFRDSGTATHKSKSRTDSCGD